MRLRSISLVFCLSLISTSVSAQSATGTSKLAWTQAGPDLTAVQAFVYRHYDDASTTGIALPTAAVKCVEQVPAVAGMFECEVGFPAFAPGAHTLTLTAGNAAGESAKSAPLVFTFFVVPSPPTILRIVVLP